MFSCKNLEGTPLGWTSDVKITTSLVLYEISTKSDKSAAEKISLGVNNTGICYDFFTEPVHIYTVNSEQQCQG